MWTTYGSLISGQLALASAASIPPMQFSSTPSYGLWHLSVSACSFPTLLDLKFMSLIQACVQIEILTI